VKIAIVEDEAVVARRLERMVTALLPDCAIRVAPTFHAALELIQSTPLDLLLLDLNLGGRDGFRLLEEAAASRFQTVVVSAHHEQALRAFEYGVTDFIAKPWSEERLRMALERVTSRRPHGRARTLVVRKGRELRTISVDEVIFARGADDYAELHLVDGSVLLHEKTLSALEALLPEGFARVHRSYVANLRHVRGLRTAPRVALVMDDESLVPVGRSYRELVRDRWPVPTY
jgi:two-component system response regulator LytT